VTYELPFFKSQKGFAGQAFGGWSLGSLMQLYTGHPVDLYVGALGSGASTRYRARDANTFVPFGGTLLDGATVCHRAAGCHDFLLDQNGVPINLGGDYNLDGVLNDHPMFLGSSLGSVYSGGSPADGIFKDNNQIGCAEAGLPSNIVTTG